MSVFAVACMPLQGTMTHMVSYWQHLQRLVHALQLYALVTSSQCIYILTTVPRCCMLMSRLLSTGKSNPRNMNLVQFTC
jgi:hypothetical protein